MDTDIYISIVIPVYNEEENLPLLTERLVKVLTQYKKYEIIYVNDASNDCSLDLIKSYSELNQSIKSLSFSRNFGHQAAISAGLAHSQGDVVIVMDGDLQDPPEIIPRFVKKWQEGYDVVYAVRKGRKENIFKKVAYFLFYRLLSRITDLTIPLDSGDFSAMDKRIVQHLNKLPERNRFVRGIRTWIGYKHIGLEYERHARFAGNPKFTLAKLIKLAYDGLISFSDKPLKIASNFGMFVTMVAFLGILFTLYLKLFTEVPIGFSSTIITILLFGGIQLTVIGVLGEYISRIFDEVKQRPNYIIMEATNIDKDFEK